MPHPVRLSLPLAEALRFRLTAADAGGCGIADDCSLWLWWTAHSLSQLSSLHIALWSNGHKLIKDEFRLVQKDNYKWDLFNIPVACSRSSMTFSASQIDCFLLVNCSEEMSQSVLGFANGKYDLQHDYFIYYELCYPHKFHRSVLLPCQPCLICVSCHFSIGIDEET